MSVLTATVVLAWGCLLVLTLTLAMAMAGMLRQLRELQAEVAALGAPQRHSMAGRRVPELAGEGSLVLLVLDPGCSFCHAVHEPFTQLTGEHPGTRFEVLSPRQWSAGAPAVRSRVDSVLVAELDLPWAPASSISPVPTRSRAPCSSARSQRRCDGGGSWPSSAPRILLL